MVVPPCSPPARRVRSRPLAIRSRKLLFLCLAALLVALFACGDSREPLAPEPAAVAQLAVTPESATVIVDSLVRLTALATDSSGNLLEGVVVSWVSSEAAVAVVDDTGLVRGVAPGLAAITATADGVSDSAAVTVLPGVASVTLSPSSWAMVREETVQLQATLKDEEGETLEGRRVTWGSSETGVATVDLTGLVTGVGSGSATITATSEGRSGTAEITVTVISFTSIRAGGLYHACGLMTDGAVYCWGGNNYGALGNGTTEGSLSPVPVSGGITFAFLTTGDYHTCGVATDGTAYCWGHGDSGQLGNGETSSSTVPVAVAGGLRFAAIAAGSEHTCAVTTTGSTYCWGANNRGQLGDNTTADSATPVRVVGDLSFASVAAGWRHTCALTSDGAGYCWGRNDYGQLGTGEASYYCEWPVPVSGGHTFTSIIVGMHDYSCGIAVDDVLYCWGHNDNGQLGRGWESSYELEVAPVAGEHRFTWVGDGGPFHNCAVATDGTVYCWGQNAYGLGDGSTNLSYVPIAVADGLAFSSVTTAYYRTCGITTAGIAYCWGKKWLGDGSSEDSATPVRVIGQP
jgi:alpha-tubulin suppressor-like RCC1 family protein